MIPKPIFNYSDTPTAGRADPDLAFALRQAELQFKQLLLASTRVAFGRVGDGRKLENFDARYVVHTFGAAPNTDETLNHLLGAIPRALINVETPLFDGTAPVVGTVTFGAIAPTATQVTVRCTAASKVATFILIP